MPPHPEKRTNKQYLLPSYNSLRVSKRTRERWKHLFQKSFEHSAQNSDTQNPCSAFAENSNNSEIATDFYEQLPNLNIYEHMNFDEDEQRLLTEITDTESSSDDLNGSSDDSCNSYNDEYDSDSDSCSDNVDDSFSNSNPDNFSNNCDSPASYSFTGFNTDLFHGSRIMFPQPQLTVADVMFMITVYSIRKNLTKKDEDDLIDRIKILAGPEFVSWNASQYARAQNL